ncbi:MAG: hypothetical protein ACRDOG_08255 [Gaiellaceae bacterium]
MLEQAAPAERGAGDLGGGVEPPMERDRLDPGRSQRLLVAGKPDAAGDAVVGEVEVERRLPDERGVAAQALARRLEGVVIVDAPVVDARLDQRQLEQAAGRLRTQGRVRLVVGIRRCRGEGENHEVGGDEDGERPDCGRRPASCERDGARDGDRQEPREREVGDGEQAPGNARIAKRRQRVPEPRVERQVRAEGEQRRNHGCDAEQGRESPLPSSPEEDRARSCEDGSEPADVDEVLEPAQLPATEEVAPFGRELPDLLQRAASFLGGAGDERVADR